MANFFQDNEDLRYYVDRGIDWDALVEATEHLFHTPDGFKNTQEAVETYRDILDLMGAFAAEEVAPEAERIEAVPPVLENGEVQMAPALDAIFQKLAQLEVHGMCLPRELGGQNCPLAVFYMTAEILGRADLATMVHNSFHGGIAMAMLVYSLREGSTEYDPERAVIRSTRFQEAIDEIRRGQAWGCMDITEPDAGSDMAALRTRATQDEHGNWFITGQKVYITSGHGKYHFVVARTEDAAPDTPMGGLDGLSMFLVKTYDEDASGQRTRYVQIDRLEEKLGQHGSVTAALNFEHVPAELVGRRGEGFRYMLTLMNNARVGVGFESLGLMEAAFRAAKAYAAERRSMGKTIDQHEMVADFLDEMESDIEGVRALAMESAYYTELHHRVEMLLASGVIKDGHQREDYELRQRRYAFRARRFTPLLKLLASEKAVEITRRAVQVLGGAGYIKEYQVERYYRDAMILPIYEGTSQIQSLMVMKDALLGALKRPQDFAKRIATARLRAASARDPLERRVAKVQSLALSSLQFLLKKTMTDKYRNLKGQPLNEWPERFMKDWDPKRDFAYAMLHAERLARQLADEAVLEILLQQAKRHADRRPILERYLERAEPRARHYHDLITHTGAGLLARLDEARADAEAPEKKSA